jgi:hypothetical protein
MTEIEEVKESQVMSKILKWIQEKTIMIVKEIRTFEKWKIRLI